MNYPLSLGVDIGSTTAKLVLMDGEKIIYQKYERHLSQVRQKTCDMVREIEPLLPHLDGIEVFNSRADYKHGGANAAAAQFAAAHGIACVTTGSDAHRGAEVGNAFVEADCPCTSDALRAALTAGAKPAGVRSPRRYIALSQLTKAKKQKLGARRTLKSAALLCYLTIKDIFQK